MQTIGPLVTLLAVLASSFAVGLFVQWLTLHALFHLLPGRHKPTVAQMATLRTRKLMMPLTHRSAGALSKQASL